MKSSLLLKSIICWMAMMVVAQAGESAEIKKVLPHLLDSKGRNSLSPSLYERDAYQDYLRKNPELQSAMRFDVQWKAKASRQAEPMVLKLEVRTSEKQFGNPLVIQRTVKPRWSLFGNWTSMSIRGEEFKELGKVIAWRATLWSGNTLVAERRSFLW